MVLHSAGQIACGLSYFWSSDCSSRSEVDANGIDGHNQEPARRSGLY